MRANLDLVSVGLRHVDRECYRAACCATIVEASGRAPDQFVVLIANLDVRILDLVTAGALRRRE